MDMPKSEYLIFDFRISHFCLRHTMVKTKNPKNKNFDIKISTEKFDLIGMVLDNE